MDNNIEERFERVMTSSAPDLLNDLLKQPITKTENEDELFSELYPKSSRKTKTKWVTAIAALAAAIVIAFLFLPKKSVEPKIMGSIIIDCNPSVKITVTEDLKIYSVEGVNDDGEQILKNFQIPETLEKAVSAVIDELKKEKYLTTEKKNILISYCYNNSNKEKSVEKAVKDSVPKDVEFVYQTFQDDKNLEKIAGEQKISVGKYKYIEKLSKENNISRKKLKSMTINEISDELKASKPESKQKQQETQAANQKNSGNKKQDLASSSNASQNEKSKTKSTTEIQDNTTVEETTSPALKKAKENKSSHSVKSEVSANNKSSEEKSTESNQKKNDSSKKNENANENSNNAPSSPSKPENGNTKNEKSSSPVPNKEEKEPKKDKPKKEKPNKDNSEKTNGNSVSPLSSSTATEPTTLNDDGTLHPDVE